MHAGDLMSQGIDFTGIVDQVFSRRPLYSNGSWAGALLNASSM